MMKFDESQFAPNGTAPEDAYVPPGNNEAEQISFCTLHMNDGNELGAKCLAWLRAQRKS